MSTESGGRCTGRAGQGWHWQGHYITHTTPYASPHATSCQEKITESERNDERKADSANV